MLNSLPTNLQQMGNTSSAHHIEAEPLIHCSYFVVLPDLFHEDPIPLNRPDDFDIMKWMHGEYNEKKIAHLPPTVDPIVKSCVDAMRSKYGVKVISLQFSFKLINC